MYMILMHMYMEQPHDIPTKYNHSTVTRPPPKITITTTCYSMKMQKSFSHHKKKKKVEEEEGFRKFLN